MNVIILADIHANFEALRPLRPRILDADRVLCLGDFIGYYCQVNEVLDFVRGLPGAAVLGNHDAFLLHGCPDGAPEAVRFGIEYADREIAPGHRRWLAGLPLVWGGALGGRTVLLAHGSPFRPLTDYLYPDRMADAPLGRFDFDLLAFGQTHRPWLDASHRPVLLNPGSVGQSRHQAGVACAALWDTETMAIEQIECPYDAGPAIELAKRNGAGEWINKHLA
ncbi:MAG: metallophosphoesterase family protein [Bryobacteraceae bacterium]|jgi:predicted phosphodiesterase